MADDVLAVPDQSEVIAAPPAEVFAALAAFGGPSPLWDGDDRPEVVERDGNVLLVRFPGRRRDELVRVRLYPPSRLTYEHLEGRHPGLRELVELVPVEGGTEVRYQGEIAVTGVVERLLVGRSVTRERRRDLSGWKRRLEARGRLTTPPAEG